MKIKVIVLTIALLTILIGCSNVKEEARYIKHSEIVNNFEKFNGELVKVEGIVWLTEDYKADDDIVILNKVDGEYTINMLTNSIGYKPYNGEYITAYGKINAVSKEEVFFDVKAVRIDTKLIEQTKELSEELKNDTLIQEFIK